MNAWNPQAWRKAEVILRVQSGLISATEAAKELRMSRKSYYKWERRALEAMMEGLCERSSGRPPGDVDGEKEQMKRRIRELERELEKKRRAEELHKRVKQLSEKKE